VAASANQDQAAEAPASHRTPPPPPAAFMNRPKVAKPIAAPITEETDEPAAKPLAKPTVKPAPVAAKPPVAAPSEDEDEPTEPVAVAQAQTPRPARPTIKDEPPPRRHTPVEDENDQPSAPAGPQVAAAPPHEEKPAEPAPKPQAAPKPRVDASKFKLTGIMEGPDGKQAIINGQFITVGQTIDGVVVTQIGTQSAELKAGDVTFHLRFE